MKKNNPYIPLLLLMLCAVVLPAHADWTAHLSQLLVEKNYHEAETYLGGCLEQVSKRDIAFAHLTLAYLAGKSNNKAVERNRIIDFFETHEGMVDIFPIAHHAVNKDIGDYLRSWRIKYPLPIRIGFVKGSGFSNSRLPRYITLGVEMSNACNYRLVFGRRMQSAGLLQKGFNFIKFPVDGLLGESADRVFFLELKTDDFVLRREIRLVVTCLRPANSGQVKEELKREGYGVAMFIENRMIAYHKKTLRRPRRLSYNDTAKNRMKLDRLGRRPPDPFDITGTKKYQRLSLPVLTLPLLAYKHLVKPNLKKKTQKPVIDTCNKLEGTFLLKDAEDVDKPLDLTVTLVTRVVKEEPI
ncbi:MAG: hypothetical protein GY765_18450 [bacterium]|nr:hypothetical protein [bacterium]